MSIKRCFLLLFLFICVFSAAINESDMSEAENEMSVRLPVIMYHSVLNSKSGKYIVSESQLESDLVAINDCGYTAVTVSEVVAFAEGKGLLPEKPILITFDDGHYNNLYYAVPILEKYKMHALFNVVGAYSNYSSTSGDKDNPNYSHLTWDEIGELERGGLISIGAHSYNMHKFKPRYGIGRIYGESYDDYKAALIKDTERLNEKLFDVCGKTPVAYAYPFGKYSNEAREILSEIGFKMFLTCNEGVSTLTFNKPECLYKIKRINRSGSYSTEKVLEKIA